MTKNEALKLALEAIHDLEGEINGYRTVDFPIPEKAKAVIKEALAQPNPTPVAFKYTDAQGKTVLVGTNVKPYDDAVPLYEVPASREWVGLMDAEIQAMTTIYSGMALYRRIEAKLKEKNT